MTKEEFQKRRTDIISKMLDNPDETGIYPTTKCFSELDDLYDEILNDERERDSDPYWYWPQCDVDGCEGVTCSQGNCWRKTGYWCVCDEHSQMHREGKPQPQMKQSAIDREKSRDENGVLRNG